MKEFMYREPYDITVMEANVVTNHRSREQAIASLATQVGPNWLSVLTAMYISRAEAGMHTYNELRVVREQIDAAMNAMRPAAVAQRLA